jgi:hypothetical protein
MRTGAERGTIVGTKPITGIASMGSESESAGWFGNFHDISSWIPK